MRLTIAAILIGATGAVATAQTLTVPATARVVPRSTAPECNGETCSVSLPNGLGRVLRVLNVTGAVSGAPAWPLVSADGGTTAPCGAGGTDIPSGPYYAGIVADRTMFLCGMFSGPGPLAPAPSRLEFRGAGDFEHLWPALRQPFFIGDGRSTGNGSVQTFAVPDGATRLYLGFAEGQPCFTGPWGGNCDNAGELAVTLSYEGSCLFVRAGSARWDLCVGQDCRLESLATGVGTIEYQWEVRIGEAWMVLQDGPLPRGAGTHVEGSRSPTLVLRGVQPWDFDHDDDWGLNPTFPYLVFRLRATGCDQSEIVAEHVVNLRFPDFTGDGNVDQDDLRFAYSTHSMIDLNQDGNVDQDDYGYLIDWIASDPTACR